MLRDTGLLHLTGLGVFLEILWFACLCFGFIVGAAFSWFLGLGLCVTFASECCFKIGDLVGCRIRCGWPVGLVGVVVWSFWT